MTESAAVLQSPPFKKQKMEKTDIPSPTENTAESKDDPIERNQNQNRPQNHHRNPKRKRKERARKPGQPPKKGDRNDKLPTYYFFLNGYRYIAPYKFEYKCFCKGRWFGREIYEVLTSEYVAYSAEYYKQAILSGRVLIRNEKVALDYKIRNGDWMTHHIHRHEPPVVHRKIEIVHEDDRIVVVNKPSGIAMHPCGKYRHNTLVYVMANEMNKKLYSIHRLDRVTSGLLLMAKTTEIAESFSKRIRGREVRKTYLARVKGRFPIKLVENEENQNNIDSKQQNEEKQDENVENAESPETAERITVSQPIRCVDHKTGRQEIHEDGKEAETAFKCISFDNESNSSLVECYPKTGRTHQIRVHLQYLGYPIVNDFSYGGEENKTMHWIPGNEEEKRELIGHLKKHWDDDCDECQEIMRMIEGKAIDIPNSSTEIWLHALRYECDDFSYSVPRPDWA